MELKAIPLEIPENGNIVVGQSHFIKTVEDIYEAIVNTVPQMKFGVAFNEASGACLTRVDGNDACPDRERRPECRGDWRGPHLRALDARRLSDQPAGPHQGCAGSLNLYCATANPVEVIVAETEQGRGILGVIDGSSPKGVEDEEGAKWRHGFLRKIGYKR